jgi:hypothetical protein
MKTQANQSQMLKPRRIKVLILVALVCSVLLPACTAYKTVNVSNDAFLSHKLWQKNYNKYDYLVHDVDSTYRLKNVFLVFDSTQLDVTHLGGDIQKYTKDSSMVLSKKELKNETRKTIDIFLKHRLEVDEDGKAALASTDIQDVTFYAKRNSGLVALFYIVVGAAAIFVALILLLIIILLFAASSDGSGGGSTSTSDPQCYIATMVYGSSESEQVLALRDFRDRALLTNRFGAKFVKWYYSNSPKFVARFQKRQWVHVPIKMALNLFIRLIK